MYLQYANTEEVHFSISLNAVIKALLISLYRYANKPWVLASQSDNPLSDIANIANSFESTKNSYIANGSWKKEDELRSLKTQAAELDRKIALELAPPEPEKEEVKESEKQEQSQGGGQNTTSQGAKQEPAHTSPLNTTTPQPPMHTPKSELEDRGVMSRVVISKPKWR